MESGTDEATAKLAEVLQDRHADLAAQIAVCEAIADAEDVDPELITPLLALLGDKRPALSDAVTQALLRFDSTTVVDQLGPLAADAGLDVEKRLSAINALGAMCDNLQAVEAVVGLLSDSSPTIRTAALASIRQASGADLSDADSALNWWKDNQNITELEWLARRNRQRAADIRRLTTESALLTARLASAYREGYHRIPEGDRPRRLLALLSDAVPGIRALALDLVNDLITDRKDIPPEIRARLVDMLIDPAANVRLHAAKIVGDLRLPGAFARLSRAITQESDPAVRVAQVNAVGRLDDANVIQVLIERLDDDVPAVVGEAALALGRTSRRTDRPKSADEAEWASLPQTLIEKYGRLQATQDELRQQFLLAMSMFADPRFRPVFKVEMAGNRAIRVRRAAIMGLSAFGDLEAADSVRACLNDPDAEIRLAAADGLAKCGRRRSDLGALAEHIDATTESDAAVRQRAWESYLWIACQLPPEEQIKVSDEFDRPTDKVAQRRRLELLKPLATDTRVSGGPGAKAGTAKFEQLPKARRIEALERMADAQWSLGEFASAAASLDQVLLLLEDGRGGRFATLAARSVAARLKAHDDAAAIARFNELWETPADEPTVRDALVRAMFEEIRSRIETATEAVVFADALNLIEAVRPTLHAAGGSYEEQLDKLRKDGQTRRTLAVDRLLASLIGDADSESKLLAYPKEAVLARIHDRLKAGAATSAPVAELETRLVQLARRLAPAWAGFPQNATPAERSAALERLLNVAASKPQNGSSSTVRQSTDSGTMKATIEEP